jgi:hypothetical protein
MRFALSWDVAPAGPDEADVTVTVTIRLLGAMRLLTPLIALGAPGRNARISAAMGRSIESATASMAGIPVAV